MMVIVLLMTKKKIITLTGASGAGKTTIAKELLEDSEKFVLLPSYTTRNQRVSDLPGEYRYVGKLRFLWHKSWRDFIWEVKYSGNFYGTKYDSINQAFWEQSSSLMILVPDTIPKLVAYTGEEPILPFYIRSPPEDILRSRLQKRGDTAENIEQCLQESKDWDLEAESSGIPYVLITNKGTIEEAVEQVRKCLK